MEGAGGGGRSGWIWSKRRGMLAKRSESGAFGASNTPLSGREWGGGLFKDGDGKLFGHSCDTGSYCTVMRGSLLNPAGDNRRPPVPDMHSTDRSTVRQCCVPPPTKQSFWGIFLQCVADFVVDALFFFFL